jgi:hypothetical protein
MSKINVEGVEITVINHAEGDYISLTDMIRNFENNHVIISNWLRRRDTLEFLSIWERLNNPDFKLIEFDELIKDAGLNRFSISPKKWIETVNPKGITSKSGRYGGTYAHKDIAFEFGMWISPQFKLLLIKEFQRLKDEETRRLNSEWDYRRFLSKVNYSIHTDAIQKYIVPQLTDEDRKKWIYAEEADLLNVSMFGFTSKQWRDANPDLVLKGYNVRDIADAHQLLVLSNLEGYNAILNQQRVDKYQKLLLLKKAAEQQIAALKKSIYTTDQIKSPYLPQKKKLDIPDISKSDEK